MLELLSRPGCHLCEEAAATLRALGVRFATTDIDDDPALAAAYGEAVPVLRLDGSEIARAPLAEDRLRQVLSSLQPARPKQSRP